MSFASDKISGSMVALTLAMFQWFYLDRRLPGLAMTKRQIGGMSSPWNYIQLSV